MNMGRAFTGPLSYCPCFSCANIKWGSPGGDESCGRKDQSHNLKDPQVSLGDLTPSKPTKSSIGIHFFQGFRDQINHSNRIEAHFKSTGFAWIGGQIPRANALLLNLSNRILGRTTTDGSFPQFLGKLVGMQVAWDPGDDSYCEGGASQYISCMRYSQLGI